MKKKAKKQNKLLRILKAPIKIFNKVKEFYMNEVFDCAERIGEGTVVNCGVTSYVSQQLPRKFSVNSSKDGKPEEEIRGLFRAVSTKITEAKVEMKTIDPHLQKQMTSMKLPIAAVEKRSYSIGVGRIGRIDEDMSCDFNEADAANAYPRSKSYAVTSKYFVC